MISPFRRAALAALCLAVQLAAQDPPAPTPPAEPDPAIAERIDALEDAWKDRKMSRDAQATRLLEELGAALDSPLHADDRKAITQVLTKILTTGKLREPDAIEPYRKAVDGLAKLGDDGAQVMIKTVDKKRFPRHADWAPMREAIVEGIGKTGAAAAVPFLLERLQRSGEDGELRAAGAALANFKTSTQKDRKAMVELLAQRLASFELQAAAPAVNQDQQLNLDRESAERVLRVIRDPFLRSMHELTGETFANGATWQHWYQENKRKDWPDRDEAP